MLASILTAKGIPNELRMSFDHIWVDYPGKRPTPWRTPAWSSPAGSDGRFFLHWPRDFDLGQEVADQVAIYWTPAPPVRVLLLAVGLLAHPAVERARALLAGNGSARCSRGARALGTADERAGAGSAPAGRRAE